MLYHRHYAVQRPLPDTISSGAIRLEGGIGDRGGSVTRSDGIDSACRG